MQICAIARFSVITQQRRRMSFPKRAVLVLATLFLMRSGGTVLAQEIPPFSSLDDPQSKQAVVATIGPWKITAEEFRVSFELGPAFARRTKGAKERYLGFMINEKLLALDTSTRTEESAALIDPVLAEVVGDLATEELFKDDVQSRVKVSGTQIARGVRESRRQVRLEWIFAPTREQINEIAAILRSGDAFDSLYHLQGPDSALAANRYLEASLFQVRMKNPLIAKVADTLKPFRVSKPLKGVDGWYILHLAHESRDMVTTESGESKLKEDVARALVQQKSDSLSELYVNTLMTENRPVIVPATLDLVASYLAPRWLDSLTVSAWRLDSKDEKGRASDRLKMTEKDEMRILITLARGRSVSLKDFLAWFRDRETVIKLQKSSKEAYLFSLKQLIWRMVRDRLLVERAYERRLQDRELVRTQNRWWREKLLFDLEKRSIESSISRQDSVLESYYKENSRYYRDAQGNRRSFAEVREDVLRDYFQFELTKRILHRINALKARYPVHVNENVLSRIPVDQDPKAIDVYAVKKGGTFPRQAFPVIDMMWRTW
jgi:hypothetical protein